MQMTASHSVEIFALTNLWCPWVQLIWSNWLDNLLLSFKKKKKVILFPKPNLMENTVYKITGLFLNQLFQYGMIQLPRTC